MHILSGMNIQANTKDVLATLIKNRETHRKVVKEARAGYLIHAKAQVAALLADLERGKVKSVNLGLHMPQDQTNVYDTAIEMLQRHTGETITLDATQARSLIMDKWDWKSNFLMANSLYSATAKAETEAVGSAPDEE